MNIQICTIIKGNLQFAICLKRCGRDGEANFTDIGSIYNITIVRYTINLFTSIKGLKIDLGVRIQSSKPMYCDNIVCDNRVVEISNRITLRLNARGK